jgi:gluconate 2-dehydrogenase gamma chain
MTFFEKSKAAPSVWTAWTEKLLLATVIRDVQMGFFADPIYGGNQDMAAWKMIGYPGARYNYLDWVGRHNERFPLGPVSITGSVDWTPKKAEALK